VADKVVRIAAVFLVASVAVGKGVHSVVPYALLSARKVVRAV